MFHALQPTIASFISQSHCHSTLSPSKKRNSRSRKFMSCRALGNEEPADAREALRKYYLAKNRNHKPTLSRVLKSSELPSDSSPPSLSPPSPSASSVSSIFTSDSPPSSRPITPPSSREWSEVVEEDGEDGEDVREHTRRNREYVQELCFCGSPTPPFPQDGYFTSWFGSEEAVERTLFFWDGGLGYVPSEDVNDAIRAFEAGVTLADMEPELRAALVHVISSAMLDGRLSHASATMEQIQYFIYRIYAAVKDRPGHPSRSRPQREHWLHGTLRDRKEEVGWLKYQGEKRFWTIHNKNVIESYQRSLEPSDAELEVLFNTYVHV